MATTISYEAEEYLEVIYRLQKRHGAAKTSELAKKLHVVPGSITNTIGHLEKHELVTHEPYRGVKLTREGEKIALDIIRKHRLAERLLTDILKAEWSSVHEEACKLEHALTKNVAALLEKRLGNPKFCPHGNPIPSENGSFSEEKCFTLTEIDMYKSCTVARIIDEKRDNLLILAEACIKPGTQIVVLEKSPNKVVVHVNEKAISLDSELAKNVLVKDKQVEKH